MVQQMEFVTIVLWYIKMIKCPIGRDNCAWCKTNIGGNKTHPIGEELIDWEITHLL